MNTKSRIVFVKRLSKRLYDPLKGEYQPSETVRKVLPCDVSDLGLERQIQAFGNYRDDRKVIHLLRPYREAFDYVEYNGQTYKVLTKRLGSSVLYIQHDSGLEV